MTSSQLTGVIMKSFSTKLVAAAALATAAIGAASAAHANPNVYLSIGLQGRPAYTAPAPVYVQPRPMFVQPRPVYVQPRPVYVAPPAFVYGRSWLPAYGRSHEREEAWRHAEWRRHYGKQHQDWDRSPAGRH
jgi:hypothetical protein